jgi:hypothetical protein
MKYSKVDGHKNLIRDEETKAIINTNMSDYNKYIMQRKIKEKDNQKLQTLEENVDNIKSDLEEIKSILRSLINEPK